MGDVDMDVEDAKSLDSSDDALQGGEENHFSNSDMVHLELEEVEMLEEAEKRREEEEEEDAEEMQMSVMSVLGGEEEQEIQAPETEEILVSAEEPYVEKEPTVFRQVVPPMALPHLPILKLDPPSTASTPVSSSILFEAEQLYSGQGLHPPFILAPMEPEPPVESLEHLKFSQIPLSDPQEHSKSESAAEKLKPEPSVPKTVQHVSSTELLCGGAALVAVVGVLAYGAVVYCRK
ncbi:hypothetical protein JOB18_021186 [Solea senegalensis]|nr:glutamate-rich protein 6 [Solea senegalensis]XP_043876040.1 glutamate-rich protein 6 [Solea senegalensis]XP_043876042.1 glutamate-rich protein 6 [Solea senegalensis]KAG7496560.1 hypothetical protein JOB18_021186 [Solea senegalensis]